MRSYFFPPPKKIFEAKTINISLPASENTPASPREEPVEIVGEESASGENPASESIAKNISKKPETEIAEEETEEKKDTKSSLSITNKFVSWGFQSSGGRMIDAIIIHSSYDALGSDPYDLNGLINEYKIYG